VGDGPRQAVKGIARRDARDPWLVLCLSGAAWQLHISLHGWSTHLSSLEQRRGAGRTLRTPEHAALFRHGGLWSPTVGDLVSREAAKYMPPLQHTDACAGARSPARPSQRGSVLRSLIAGEMSHSGLIPTLILVANCLECLRHLDLT